MTWPPGSLRRLASRPPHRRGDQLDAELLDAVTRLPRQLVVADDEVEALEVDDVHPNGSPVQVGGLVRRAWTYGMRAVSGNDAARRW